mgnify:FL=1
MIPLSINVSGLEGGVTLKNLSTDEEWLITENGAVSLSEFLIDSTVDLTVIPTSALQVCRLNSLSDTASIQVSEPLYIECDNKILLTTIGDQENPIYKSIWIMSDENSAELLVASHFAHLYSKRGVYFFFNLDGDLWKTDGSKEGTVVINFDGMSFVRLQANINENSDELFVVVADSNGKEFLYEVDDNGSVIPVNMPDDVSISDVKVTNLSGRYIFYSSSDKRFFSLSDSASSQTLLTLEQGDSWFHNGSVFENELLILSIENNKQRLRVISGVDNTVRELELPDAVLSSLLLQNFNSFLIIEARKTLNDTENCTILYKYSSSSLATLVDYCTERTDRYHSLNISYHDKLLIVERSKASDETVEVLEVTPETLDTKTILSTSGIQGYIIGFNATDDFLFFKTHAAMDNECDNFLLCNHQARYYSWIHQRSELIELVEPQEVSGFEWFFGQIIGIWGQEGDRIFDKIYFSYKHSDFGLEPWVTDGTTEGTKLLKDIEPGDKGSLFLDLDL